jgi:hypothetical protein
VLYVEAGLTQTVQDNGGNLAVVFNE